METAGVDNREEELAGESVRGRLLDEGRGSSTAAEILYVSNVTGTRVAESLRHTHTRHPHARHRFVSPRAGRTARSNTRELKESSEVDPRIVHLRTHFYSSKFSLEDRKRCPWDRVKARLLANNGHYLVLANAMNGGGVLFGVDRDGNPLIADADADPTNLPHSGLNYTDSRKAVSLKNPRGGWKQNNLTGYEMFPYDVNGDKSDEIRALERFTGKPFVESPDDRERSSWVESGESPAWPRCIKYFPYYQGASLSSDLAQTTNPNRGVRRLLRVKES